MGPTGSHTPNSSSTSPWQAPTSMILKPAPQSFYSMSLLGLPRWSLYLPSTFGAWVETAAGVLLLAIMDELDGGGWIVLHGQPGMIWFFEETSGSGSGSSYSIWATPMRTLLSLGRDI
ncbi:Uu.00g022460.m01.CDS01 [Anthostomella pinea]|uniref:Uu.00g022460.m01.CDS01 n=1 Tax=Anthostomella pinea TaxID=933095 RepID=A0AAI8VZV4_9PEZI|nr:Uu.00g022460.m01.CDS01 [Anthostomella pinea]